MAVCETINWDQASDEAIEHLKNLIRFDTTNPPGNEKPAAHYLAEALSKDGLEPEVIDSAENRANMVCRLRGSGEKPPLLLHGHLDVVPVEQEAWSVPAFDAVEKDGFVWGRGAVDMKNMVAMSLMCMLLLKRAGAPLKRDLIFCAVADEEAGGRFGSQFMVENHPDKVRAEYAIGEMGGFSMEMDGNRFYLVQVAEKGMCWFRIKTKGNPGHGSIPDPESAPVKAARVVAALGGKRLPQHNCEAITRFVNKMSPKLKFPKNSVFRLLLNPALSGFLLDNVFPDKDTAQSFNAMLHNTANPTVIRAGEKTNLVPSYAEIEVDGRILPGCSTEDFLQEVRDHVKEEMEIEVIRELTPTEAPADDQVMRIFEDAIKNQDPEAVILPYLLTGFSDATHWKKLGMKCYGFSPFRLPPGMNIRALAHAHDERIPLDGFRFGLRALFDAVEKVVT